LRASFAQVFERKARGITCVFVGENAAEMRASFDLFSEQLSGENRARKLKNAQEILPDFEREHATDF
jgi:hypothetical protein